MKKFIAAVLALCFAATAYAQTGTVNNHAVAVGKGPGVQGFTSVAPGPAGQMLISNGPGSDPSFQALQLVLAPPFVVTTAPVYNILFSNSVNPVTVNGAPAEFDHMRISQPGGGNNQYTITGTGSQVAGLNFQMESLSGSAASSNMYGVVGAVTNDGPGNVKGLYGRATFSSGSTGVGVGLVSGITTVSTATTAYGIQIGADTYTNASAIPITAGIIFGPTDGASAVKVTNGILFDSHTAIQAGGSALRAFANGAGDFATLLNAAGNANLFQVSSAGNVGVGVQSGAFGFGENLSVNGFAVVGSSGGPQGIYGNTGAGTVVIGGVSNHTVELRANNARVAGFTPAGGMNLGTTTDPGAGAFLANKGIGTVPTVVASLPTCNAGFEGQRAYVTDQNTAVAYRGAVTGGGTTRQAVLCSNSAWIQD